MEPDIAVLGLVVASAGLIASLAASISSALRFRRRLTMNSGRKLEVRVDGKTYTIDVGAIEKEDPRKIDRAIREVRARKREMAA